MYSTKCNNPACINTSYEVNLESIKGAETFIHFVICLSCKTTIGILDIKTVMERIEELQNKIDESLNH